MLSEDELGGFSPGCWECEAETDRGGVWLMVVEGVGEKNDVRVVLVTDGEMPGLMSGLVEPVEGGPRYI